MIRVLLIDDDPDFARLAMLRLEGFGYEVLLAHNTLQGLVKARAAKPDVVLLDIMLPEGNGIDLIHDMRAETGLKHLPIILVSGHEKEKHLKGRGHMEHVDYMQKPVDFNALKLLIDQWTARRSEPCVLAVDDEPEIVDLVQLRLEMHGYRVLKAYDGAQAVATAHDKHPDLILLDLMMPNVDGYEACHRLKSDVRTQDIPVILFTAKTQMADPEKWRESRADDFILKPFDPKDLLEKIKFHLQKRR